MSSRSDIGVDCPTGSLAAYSTRGETYNYEIIAIGCVLSFVASIAILFSLLVIVGLSFAQPMQDIQRHRAQADEAQVFVGHRSLVPE